jgi:hypothetical protein
MEGKPFLVIVTAGWCGHCARYKKQGEKGVVEMIAKEGRVNLVRINDDVPEKGVHVNPNYGKYVGFFPTFMLVTYDSWMGNKPLEGAIMNQIMGHYEGKNFVPTIVGKSEYGFIAEDISKWITQQLKTNPIFNRDIPSSLQIDNTGQQHHLKDLSQAKDKTNHRGKETIRMGFESDSE